MRFITLLIGSSLAVGCTGTGARQLEEINGRLTRIEARLEALTANAPAANDAMRSWSRDELALRSDLIVDEILELKAQGFTDEWRPVQQLKAELEFSSASSADSDAYRTAIVGRLDALSAQGFLAADPRVRQLKEELKSLDQDSR